MVRGTGTQQELGSLTQTHKSLCSLKTERWMSEKQWPQEDLEWASVSWCAVDCLQMGVGGGKREEKRSLLRAWSLSFCYLVLFALVRLTESSFTSMTY